MPEFPCSGPIAATIRMSSGDLRVIAEDRSSVEVDVQPGSATDAARAAATNTRVDFDGHNLLVETPQARGFVLRRSPHLNVSVRVPLDSRLRSRSASADIVCHGRLGATNITIASGDARLDHIAGDLDCHAASGNAYVDRVDGDASLSLASGDARIGTVSGEITARSASGDIDIDAASGSARISSASGDIRVHRLAAGTAKINTASGDVVIGVAEGTAVWLDLNSGAGTTRSDLNVSDAPPPGTTAALTLHVRTASGDITVRRAPVHQPPSTQQPPPTHQPPVTQQPPSAPWPRSTQQPPSAQWPRRIQQPPGAQWPPVASPAPPAPPAPPIPPNGPAARPTPPAPPPAPPGFDAWGGHDEGSGTAA